MITIPRVVADDGSISPAFPYPADVFAVVITGDGYQCYQPGDDYPAYPADPVIDGAPAKKKRPA